MNIAGYTWQAPERERQNDWVTKIDHVFSGRHSAFVRISKGYQNTYCDNVNGGLAPFPGVSCLVNTTRDPYNVAGSWRWNPGSSMVNEFVAGVNHFTFDFITPEADPSKFTVVNFQVTAPHDYEVGNLRTIDTYQIVDNLSYVRGAHRPRAPTGMSHVPIQGGVSGARIQNQRHVETEDEPHDRRRRAVGTADSPHKSAQSDPRPEPARRGRRRAEQHAQLGPRQSL